MTYFELLYKARLTYMSVYRYVQRLKEGEV